MHLVLEALHQCRHSAARFEISRVKVPLAQQNRPSPVIIQCFNWTGTFRIEGFGFETPVQLHIFGLESD